MQTAQSWTEAPSLSFAEVREGERDGWDEGGGGYWTHFGEEICMPQTYPEKCDVDFLFRLTEAAKLSFDCVVECLASCLTASSVHDSFASGGSTETKRFSCY